MKKLISGLAVLIISSILFAGCSDSNSPVFHEVNIGSSIVIDGVNIRLTETMGLPSTQNTKYSKDLFINIYISATEGQEDIGVGRFSVLKSSLLDQYSSWGVGLNRNRELRVKIKEGKILIALYTRN